MKGNGGRERGKERQRYKERKREHSASKSRVSVLVSHCKANGHFARARFPVASCCNMLPCPAAMWLNALGIYL